MPMVIRGMVDWLVSISLQSGAYPMPLSMYDVSVPLFVRMLGQLPGLLDKAEAHSKAQNSDPVAFLTLRLHPTMWNLAEQVRAACNFPVRAAARLTGTALPQFDGKDDSLEALKQRIAFTLKFVESVPASAFEGSETREISFPRGDTQYKMSGKDYLFNFALPNFYFHLTAAYAILRQHGVALEKEDYLGRDSS
jgi:uncharacterized protein